MSTTRQKSKVRLKDVAAQSGVSIATVSMVLSNRGQIGAETKERIKKICQDMGYSPPTRQHRQTSPQGLQQTAKRFGLIYVGDPWVITKPDPQRWEEIQNLTAEALKLNVRLETMFVSEDDVDDFIEKHMEQFTSELDAVLLSGLVSPKFVSRILRCRKPCVIMGGIQGDVQQQHELGQSILTVKTNFELAGRLATTSLINTGHRRIAFIAERIAPGLFFDMWLSGYRLAHLDAGLYLDDTLVVTTGKALSGGAPAARVILAMENKPTAYVIPDARIATSFIKAMNVDEPQVRKDNTVICTVSDIADYAMEDYPQIGSAHNRNAQLCFEHMLRLCDNPNADVYEIYTPLVSKNLPGSAL